MSMYRPGLKLISLIPGCGYGDAACEYAVGLANSGINICWYPTRDNTADLISLQRATADVASAIAQQMALLWNQSIKAEAFLLDLPPWRWHEYWLQAEPQLRPFCYLAWEVGRLPRQWLQPLNKFEKVFVPSAFNRNTLIAEGVTVPVEIIPHIARDTDSSANGEEGLLVLGNVRPDDFVFYTIGAWTTRKDMESTIRSYLDTFTADDRVALVIKTDPLNQIVRYSQSRSGETATVGHTLGTPWAVARLLAEYPNAARIHLIAQRLTPHHIDRLHRRGDCFVSLTHSEGWGLGAFDAALHGNPVIIPGWGGPLDYLGENYPLLVDYELRATDQYEDDGYFHRGPDIYWAHANRAHASELMRSVFESQASTRTFTLPLKNAIAERYSSSNISKKLADAMELTGTSS